MYACRLWAAKAESFLCLARRLRSDSGANLVEFALSISIVIAALMGVLYFSLALYANHFVSYASQEAGRYAMVRGSTWSGTSCAQVSTSECMATSSDIARYVTSILPPGFSASGLQVSAAWPGTTSTGAPCDTANGNNSPYCTVNVTVSYSFSSFLPFIPAKTLAMSNTSSFAIVE